MTEKKEYSELPNEWVKFKELLGVPHNLHNMTENNVWDYSLEMDWSFDYTTKFIIQVISLDKLINFV